MVKTEYYKYVLQSDLQTFYQLNNSITLDKLYFLLQSFQENTLRLANRDSSPKLIKSTLDQISDSTNSYIDAYKTCFRLGELDRTILRKISSSNEEYKEIVSKI